MELAAADAVAEAAQEKATTQQVLAAKAHAAEAQAIQAKKDAQAAEAVSEKARAEALQRAHNAEEKAAKTEARASAILKEQQKLDKELQDMRQRENRERQHSALLQSRVAETSKFQQRVTDLERQLKETGAKDASEVHALKVEAGRKIEVALNAKEDAVEALEQQDSEKIHKAEQEKQNALEFWHQAEAELQNETAQLQSQDVELTAWKTKATGNAKKTQALLQQLHASKEEEKAMMIKASEALEKRQEREDSLESQLESVGKQLKDDETKLHDANKDLEQKNIILKSLKTDSVAWAKQNAENEELHLQVNRLQDEGVVLRKEFEKREHALAAKNDESYRTLVEAAVKLRSVTDERDQLQKQKGENDSAQVQLKKTLDTIDGERKQLQMALQSARTMLNANSTRNALLERQVADESLQIANLQTEKLDASSASIKLEQVEAKWHDAETHSRHMEEEEQSLKTELAESLKRATALAEQKDTIQDNYRASHQAAQLLSSEVSSLREKLEGLQKSHDNLLQSTEALRTLKDTELVQAQELQQAADRRADHEAELKKELERKDAKVREMQNTISDLEDAKKASADHLNVYFEENVKLAQQHDQMVKQDQNLKASAASLNAKVAMLEDRVRTTRHAQQMDEANTHAVWENDEQKIQTLQKTNANLETQLEAAKAQLKAKEKVATPVAVVPAIPGDLWKQQQMRALLAMKARLR